MNKSNKIIFSLLLFFSSPVFGMEIIKQPDAADKKEDADQKKINPLRLAAKCGVGVLSSFQAHYYLGYISTYIHEHSHGLASGYSDYTSVVYPSQAPSYIRRKIFPWQGATSSVPFGKTILKKMVTGNDLSLHDQRKAREILILNISRVKNMSKMREFFYTVNGPLAGIFTTYLQCVGIEILNGFIHNRPLKESLMKVIRFRFSFFSDAYKTGKKYCSYLLGKKIDENTEEPSWSLVVLSSLMFWRRAGMIYEFMYGLLPCGSGDGQEAWNVLLQKPCPSLLNADNLFKPTLGIMCIPYIVGALQALISK